jgi:integrase
MRLNQKALDSLSSDGKRRDIKVAGLPGLIVRVAPSRGQTVKTWRLRFVRSGKPAVLTLGTFPTLSVAGVRVLHAELMEVIKSGGDPKRHAIASRLERLPESAKPTGASVADCVAEFLKVIARQRKRPEQAKALLEANVLPEIGDMPAAEVRKRDIVRVCELIVQRGSPVQANRVFALLKQVFAVAADRDLIEFQPSFPRNLPGGAEKPRTRVLTDTEIALLWKTLNELTPVGKRGKAISRPLALALKLLLVTAQRRGELAAAKWSDIIETQFISRDGVRITRQMWRIPETKNGKPHLVPLSPLAQRLLEELRQLSGESDYLLPNTVDNRRDAGDRDRTLTKAARRVREHLDIPDWTPHDLRRTARTGMAFLGIADAVGERVLNHSVGDRMIAVYNQHQYAAEMADALDRWAAHLEELTK